MTHDLFMFMYGALFSFALCAFVVFFVVAEKGTRQ